MALIASPDETVSPREKRKTHCKLKYLYSKYNQQRHQKNSQNSLMKFQIAAFHQEILKNYIMYIMEFQIPKFLDKIFLFLHL